MSWVEPDLQSPSKRRKIDDGRQPTASPSFRTQQTTTSTTNFQYTGTSLPQNTQDISTLVHEKEYAEQTVHGPAHAPTFRTGSPVGDSDTIVAPFAAVQQLANCNNHASNHGITVDQVCFGMFAIDDVKILEHALPLLASRLTEVVLQQDRLYVVDHTTLNTNHVIGRLVNGPRVKAVAHLKQHKSIFLEMLCYRQSVLRYRNRRKQTLSYNFRLLVNVYGPRALFESVGKFFDYGKICLEDPVQCSIDVPYLNPHTLPDDDVGHAAMTTGSFKPSAQIHEFSGVDDVFNQLVLTEDLPEAEVPAAIRTILHRHQRQALYFMQQKEQGFWINEATGDCQPCSQELRSGDHAVETVRGGVVADQMGLGKTLQIIALIVSDLDSPQRATSFAPHSHPLQKSFQVKATLVVLPLSLLQTWTDQLLTHVSPGILKVHRFYGPRRSLTNAEIEGYDVVLTTYDTVVAESHRSENSRQRSILFSATWRRIVLDEAHYIRNASSKRTQCVCTLDAGSYWAMTGTPIQNRLTDFHALLRFIRASPYDDLHIFDTHIVRPWKTNLDSSAVARLKSLVKAVTIRRTKAAVHLPPRTDLIRHIEFDATERQQYEILKGRLKSIVSDAMENQQDKQVNILRWIDSLRGMCSFGAGVENDGDGPVPDLSRSPDYQMEQNMEFSIDMDKPFDPDETLDLDLDTNVLLEPADTQDILTMRDHNWPADSDEGQARYLQIPTIGRSMSGASSPRSEGTSEHGDIRSITSKIQALLSDLTSHNGKSVVFSFWRATLALINETLLAAGISCLVLDGSKSVDDRNSIIDSFSRQPDVKVLLSTISSGGVGIDLTAASQVCLMEPQWNPTTEEQALSRVHRMNQKHPVTTIRYVVKNTIEENILELQRRKVELASLAFDTDRKSTAKELLHDLRLLL